MHRCSNHSDEIDRAFEALLSKNVAALKVSQSAFQDEIRDYAQWRYDLDSCTLSLSGARSTKKFQITPIATYVRSANEWLWAWANDAFPENARHRSYRIRELARQTQYQIFDSLGGKVRESDIFELCALAIGHLRGIAFFKAESESRVLYLAVEKLLSEEANQRTTDNSGAPPLRV